MAPNRPGDRSMAAGSSAETLYQDRHSPETITHESIDPVGESRRLCPLPHGLSGFASAGYGGEVKLDGRTFMLPDGFTIERIAGPPLLDSPITAALDELGRLYIADSSGSNDNVKKQLAEKPHRIVCLEDTDRDGRFDKQTVSPTR